MDKRKKISILHVSDLHISDDKEEAVSTREFHKALAKHLSAEFNGNIDYIIASGDFGDKCFPLNVTLAEEWLTELRIGLGVCKSNMFLCAGNHDIETEKLFEPHHDMRLDFIKGREYKVIPNGYKMEAFERYSGLSNKVIGNVIKGVIEKEQVRFIVLNSSWLSQEHIERKKNQKGNLVKAALAVGEDKAENAMVNSLLKEFSIVCKKDLSEEDILLRMSKDKTKTKTKTELLCESLYDYTLRFSENVTQQLILDEKDLEEINSLPNDSKLNILIFHHPHTCLHPFERTPINGISNSGKFDKLIDKSHVLVCGHIHPVDNMEVINQTMELPMLIGGKTNPYSDDVEHKSIRPLFYVYNFLFEDKEWALDRKQYYNAGLGGKDFKVTEDTVETIPLILRKQKYFPETSAETIKPFKISDDEGYRALKVRFVKWLNDQYLGLLKVVNGNYTLSTEQKWVSIQPNLPGSVKKLVLHYKFIPTDGNGKTIVMDYIFSEDLQHRSFASIRAQGGIIHGEETGSILYLPLIIDLVNALVPEADRARYMAYTKEVLNGLFPKDAENTPRSLNSALRFRWPEGASGVRFFTEYLFVDPSAAKSLMFDNQLNTMSYQKDLRIISLETKDNSV